MTFKIYLKSMGGLNQNVSWSEWNISHLHDGHYWSITCFFFIWWDFLMQAKVSPFTKLKLSIIKLTKTRNDQQWRATMTNDKLRWATDIALQYNGLQWIIMSSKCCLQILTYNNYIASLVTWTPFLDLPLSPPLHFKSYSCSLCFVQNNIFILTSCVF